VHDHKPPRALKLFQSKSIVVWKESLNSEGQQIY
jgi:hypothetical protein